MENKIIYIWMSILTCIVVFYCMFLHLEISFNRTNQKEIEELKQEIEILNTKIDTHIKTQQDTFVVSFDLPKIITEQKTK